MSSKSRIVGARTRQVSFEVDGKPMSSPGSLAMTWDNTKVQAVSLRTDRRDVLDLNIYLPLVTNRANQQRVIPVTPDDAQLDNQIFLPMVAQ